jgi:hypothetical protein
MESILLLIACFVGGAIGTCITVQCGISGDVLSGIGIGVVSILCLIVGVVLLCGVIIRKKVDKELEHIERSLHLLADDEYLQSESPFPDFKEM